MLVYIEVKLCNLLFSKPYFNGLLWVGSSLMGWGMGMVFSLPLSSSVNIFVSFLLKQASGSVCNGFIIEMGPF
jgi:hypothetical protein